MKISTSLLFLFIVSSMLTFAQTGKDGAYTVTTAGQVLNRYSPVSADISIGSTSVAISPGPLFSLCPGDLVMVYQAQGANMDATNTLAYGNILNYNSAGLYEFKYVQSYSNGIITVQTTFTNSYATLGKTQVVKVPQYSTLTINNSAGVAAKPWKDTTIASVLYRFGGLVVLHAASIVNNGSISASGNGFRGGAVFYSSGLNLGNTAFRSTLNNQGGEKGEGICGYQIDYDNNNGRYCMGAPANGGGGGNGHNAGGGGGANGFNGNAWTGQGVMIVNSSNLLAAWSLSSGFIANGNALTNSSGGGHAGYSYGDANANATTQGPGNNAWVGDSRREVGGIGGRPLTNIDSETRIYFGGGGGAPHADNNASGSGANGGGIVYLIASFGISGTGTIVSNGNSAVNTSGCNCDGAAGAGAGGSIVIKTGAIAASQIVSVTGGAGGNQMFPISPSNPNESEGPGGGGGGGFVAISTGAIIPVINGGANGTTLSNAVANEMTSNGATEGASGQTGTVTSSFISYMAPAGTATSACSGSTLSLFSPSAGTSYQWSGPGGYNSNANPALIPNFGASGAGVYSLTVVNNAGCSFSTTYTLSALNSPTLSVQNKTICAGAKAILSATGAVTYSWNTSQTSSTVQVNPSSTTVYTVTGFGANGCASTSTVQVKVTLCDGLPELQSVSDLLIYPNPNKGNFTVQSTTSLDLKLVNELGQMISLLNFNAANNYSCRISGLAKGVYFLVSLKDQVKTSKKLVVLE